MYDGRSLSVSGSTPAGSGGNGLATFCCNGRYGLGDSGVGDRLQHEEDRKKGGISSVSIVYDPPHRERSEAKKKRRKDRAKKVCGVETHHLLWVSLSRASLTADLPNMSFSVSVWRTWFAPRTSSERRTPPGSCRSVCRRWLRSASRSMCDWIFEMADCRSSVAADPDLTASESLSAVVAMGKGMRG